MLSDLERKTLREDWLAAEIRGNYFAGLSFGYRRRERVAKWGVLISSCGALLAVLAGLPSGLAAAPHVLAAISAGVSVWLLVVPNQTRATECADLHFEWNKLAEECGVLWDNMYAEGASASLRGLRAQTMNLSSRATHLPNRARLMKKWESYVIAQHHAAI
jgi:hypothetical protein